MYEFAGRINKVDFVQQVGNLLLPFVVRILIPNVQIPNDKRCTVCGTLGPGIPEVFHPAVHPGPM